MNKNTSRASSEYGRQSDTGFGHETQHTNNNAETSFGRKGGFSRQEDGISGQKLDNTVKGGSGFDNEGERDERNNDNHPKVTNIKSKQSFASLFKENRIADAASMLQYIAPPVGEVEIGIDEIETVENAFGFCLVGYVMGRRPNPHTVLNFVEGWGSNVEFFFKENGWIKFQFQNEEERDRVLNGGPYIMMGRYLFLKKLPSCFLYSKDDMVFLPSWIQIYGLPADCWTTLALSRIASVVGKPIHTDKLTISKKGSTYARVLVELDAKKQRIWEYSVKLPTGKRVLLKFKYELEQKFCDLCNTMGHLSDMCGSRKKNDENKDGDKGRGNDKSPIGSRHKEGNIFHDPLSHQNQGPETRGVKESVHVEEDTVDNKHLGLEQVHLMNNTTDVYIDDDPPLNGMDVEENEKSNEMIDDWDFESDELEVDTVDVEDELSCVVPQDKEEWTTVSKKNKRFKNKKYLRQVHNKQKMMDSGSSSMETEYVPIDPRSKLPIKGGSSKFIKGKNVEVRLPKTASGFS